MAIFLSVRSQRGANRNAEATEQLIVFQLRGEWFALSVSVVQKVISLGKVYGDPSNTGISLTLHQGQEIVVVDVGQRIFKGATPTLVPGTVKTGASKAQDSRQQRCLVLVQNSAGEVVGVPIDSQPSIRRVTQSDYAPLPSVYLNKGDIHCVSSMIVDDGGTKPLFLLDPDQLSSV